MDNSFFIEAVELMQKYRLIYEHDGRLQDWVDAMFVVLSDIGLPPNTLEVEQPH